MRFWAKVSITEGCWEWCGARDRDGYGVHSGDRWWGYAHRRAWVLLHGPLPAGLHVCHTCDNRACVRPSHLWVGDVAATSHDRDAKGRWAGGDRRGRRTLLWSREQRAAFGQHYLLHVLPVRLAAAQFGVNPTTILLARREAAVLIAKR